MFIARQPIFNKEMNLYGYELLFRAKLESGFFADATATIATATVLGGLFETGIEHVVDGKRAFINFDYDFILSDSIELINPDFLVIEVLENVKVDNLLQDRLEMLRKKGYKIALDDFVEDYSSYPLVSVADIIKYDIIETPLKDIGDEVKKALSQNKILLAEKIETEEEFQIAKKMGFHLFQGYFFSKPSIVGKSNDRKSTKAQYARMISELKKEEPSYRILAQIIESDVNLVYRLMKVISNRKDEKLIDSIKRSLVYMGFKELERWINILMLQELADKKPKELIKLSLVRSKFSEFIANHSKFRSRKLEISMMCLFSALDAILDVPMEEALSGIALTDDVRNALLKKESDLRPICEIICAYESGLWGDVHKISTEIGMDEEKLTQGYFNSLKWANEVLNM